MKSVDQDDSEIPVVTVASFGHVDHISPPPANVPSAPSAPSDPPAPSAPPAPPALAMQNEAGAREFLREHNWPLPLQNAFLADMARLPLRFFICDDSGSMSILDGKKLTDVAGQKRFMPCSRWAELTMSLHFHVQLAHQAQLPTEFRLLNVSEVIRVGFEQTESEKNVGLLQQLFEATPNRGTPLCHHVREVVKEIQRLSPQLHAHRQRAIVIIATDGESSDGDVSVALRPLKDLPCHVVLRLCTDQNRTVNYWNKIDSDLELNMDVLDDLSGEAEEIGKVNPWLTYSEELHRLREWGLSFKEMDLLDEQLLPLEQMRKVCRYLYGPQIDTLPLPEIDLEGFAKGLEELNKQEGWQKVRNPITGEMGYFVESDTLRSAYSAKSVEEKKTAAAVADVADSGYAEPNRRKLKGGSKCVLC